ncbi:MAG: serine/threonine protein kinase [bacterium]|nr:serine/threonine protein kinase [bacterium]
MSRSRDTEPGGRRPPGRGAVGYDTYIPDYFDRLRPLERLAPYSKMSCVFRMYDRKLGERVILKMPANLGMARPEQCEWIEREIVALQAFRHAYAPHLIDCDTDGYGLPYFTLREIDGPTLDRFISDRHRRGRALELAIELSEVVAALHDAGLIHRDIKPENVMLERDGHIRLIDFGIAGPPGEGSETASGRGAGTRPYAPPEQGTNREQPATDVYALGLVLYELITGVRVPAPRGRSEPRVALRSWVRARLRRGLRSPLVGRIILRCLDDDPDRRFADARELERALRRYVQIRRLRHVWTALAIVAAVLGLLAWRGFTLW